MRNSSKKNEKEIILRIVFGARIEIGENSGVTN